MTEVRIGALRYDVIADTEKFEKDMFASRTEIQQSKKAFNESRTPAERYGREVEKLNNLRRKGLIDAATYRRALDKEALAYDRSEQQAKERLQADKRLNDERRKSARLAKEQGRGRDGGFGRGMLAGRGLPKISPGLLKAGAVGAGVGVGVAALGKAYSEAAQGVKRLNQEVLQAKKLGLLQKELVSLRLAGQAFAGMAEGTVDSALQRFTRRVAEAAGGAGEATGAIKELGLDAQELKLLGPAESLKRVAEAFKNVKDPSDQLRLSFKLFDTEGAAFVNVLKQGAAGLDEMAEKAGNLGLTLGAFQQEQLEGMNKQLTIAGKQFQGMKNTLSVMSVPFLERGNELIGLVGRGSRTILGIQEDVTVTLQDQLSKMTDQRMQQEKRIAAEQEHAEWLKTKQAEDRAAAERQDDSIRQFLAGLSKVQKVYGKTREQAEHIRLAEMGATRAAHEQLRMIQMNRKAWEDWQAARKASREGEVQKAQDTFDEAKKAVADFDKGRKQFGGRGAVGAQRGSREEFAILRDLKRQKNDSAKRAVEAAEAKGQRERLITAQESAAASLEALKNKDPVVGGV